MNKIGIIGAMDEEIAHFLQQVKNIKTSKYNIFTFYEGEMHGKKVVVVKSGVGKVFAAMICQYLIDRFKVDAILFTGIGGALNKNLRIGDVVVGKDSVHHDFDATPLGFKRGNISFTNYRFFKSEEKLANIALKTKLDGHKIILGRIATGDQFLTAKHRKEHTYLTKELCGDCVEMEGAAVAQVCYINEIPHLIIRTISDRADGKAVKDFNQFKLIVSENSFKVVEEILRQV